MLDIAVVERRYSDLVAAWVGDTETSIAAAFEEAADLKSFLIFDEADFLLSDRRGARNRWEIMQVNEMLTRMERHPMPFACTTNVSELLDPASLRRFVFKIKFDTMNAIQARRAFSRFFGVPAPVELSELEGLTAGDFATVQRKSCILETLKSVDLIQMLESEVDSRGSRARRVGF